MTEDVNDTQSDQLNAGDQVQLVSVPDWLIHDLPDDERCEILSCVGKVTVITEIDGYGYYWLGFSGICESSETEDGIHAIRGGPSFCVPRECLNLIQGVKQ